MTRRAWLLVAANLLVPGAAQVVAGNRRLGRFGLAATLLFWVLALTTIALAVFQRSVLIELATTAVAVAAICLLLAAYAVLWVVLTLDALRLTRLARVRGAARVGVAGVALVGLLATAGGAGYLAVSGASAVGVLAGVFGGGRVAEPIDGRYNILLLGADAGPDRLGLRPDSISVVSVDAETGEAVIFGIPRNLERAPFAEGSPLWQRFPSGYDCGSECLISYLYTYASERPELYPDAERDGSYPGVEATRDAVEGVLGISLQYYVLVDMAGFEELVDALGGIEIEVTERLPIGSNTHPDGSPAQPEGYIEAGVQRMDGFTALWYARTRYGSDDFARMERQREVQEAMFAQLDPATVVLRFNQIAAAGAGAVTTDIPARMLSHFVGLAESSREHELEKIDFVPPEVQTWAPDFAAIRERVATALDPSPE